jgi:dTDP-4-amino-4,6-dideoxygalactose transaminase
MRAHGMTTGTLDRARGRAVGYDVVDCGHNFRMDELRAAMGLTQLERLLGWNEIRRALTAQYREALKEAAPDIVIPFAGTHACSGHIMPVLLPEGTDRQRVMAAMLAQGIQTSVHYPPIHRFQFYQDKFPTPALPQTEIFCERELTVPLHPRISAADLNRVVVALRDAVRGRHDA